MVVLVRGPVDDATGFSEVTRGLALGLKDSGAAVRLQPLSWGTVAAGIAPEMRLSLEEMKESVVRPDVVITVGIPPSFARWGASAAVGLGMVEVDRAPRLWAPHCNDMDEVWVPSTFSYEAFLRGGVRQERLRVMPLGVDTQLFCPGPERSAALAGSSFEFLSVFEWVPRKGFDLLIRAYVQEFSASEPVRLVIRSHSNGPDYDPAGSKIGEEIARLAASCGKRDPPAIALVPEVLPKPAMPGLYRNADCFVLPTRGEGWNLPALEASACGVPVITTAWSSHLDFLSRENAYLIEIEGLEPVPALGSPNDEIYIGSRWSRPSMKHLRVLMRHVYEHREEAAQRGASARETVVSQYSWSSSVGRMLQRLNEMPAARTSAASAVASAPRPQGPTTRLLPRQSVTMVVPSWGQRCGVAQYAAGLSNALSQVGCKMSIARGRIEEVTSGEPRDRGEVVHVQYEYSLFDHELFRRFREALKERGRKTVITLHSFTAGAHEQNEFLRVCSDQLVVHSTGLLETLRFDGWRNPIEVVPMAVPHYSLHPAESVASEIGLGAGPSIGFTGFMHWYKGLIPLVEAVGRLRTLYPQAKCHVFSAVSENPGSAAFYRHLLSYLRSNSLEDVVSLHMGWCDEEKIVQYLHAMDVNVLPYADCGYVSSSAAARLALAAQRPLVTSDSPFFDDLSDEVLKVGGAEPEAILDAIIVLLTEAGLGDQLVSRMSAYVARNTWTELARRHVDLYRSLALSRATGEGEPR